MNTFRAPAPRIDFAQLRATAAMARLQVDGIGPATVFVLNGARPAAWSWDNGRIVITSGLVDLLPDDELAAVLAHELGHIYLTHGLTAGRAPFALRGSGVEEEQRADATSARLLRQCAIPPTALPRALALVRDSPLTPDELKPALSQRIDFLLRQCPR